MGIASRDDLAQPTFNALQSLRGKISGVNIFTNSGSPTGSNRVVIRGTGSINASTDPLFVVDGVVMEDGLEMMNPNDIESIEVLKDASATAIYGARGANGVILITTERGGTDEAIVVGYNTDFSIGRMRGRMDVMNAEEFMEVQRIGLQNVPLFDPNVDEAPEMDLSNDPDLFDAQGNPLYDTDWQDAATRTAYSHNHQLSIQGGGENSSVGAFLNFTDREGIFLNSFMNRASLKVVYDVNPRDWLSFGTNLTVSRTSENNIQESGGGHEVRRTIVEMSPIFPIIWPEGTERAGTYSNSTHVNGLTLEGQPNPVHRLLEEDRLRDRTQLFGNTYAALQINESLEFRTQFGINNTQLEARNFGPRDLITAGASFYASGGFGGSNAMMDGYMSGLFDNEGKGERIQGQIAHDLSLNPLNLSQFLGSWWSGKYLAIARSNLAIERIPDIEVISDAEAQRLLAEARYFRALNYFSLVRSFGDVPLVLEPTRSLEGIFVERTNSEAVYDQIVTDLNWALNNGGLADVPFPDNNGRVTHGTVAALLADVHLQMAGYPLQAAGNYVDAANAARTVIQSGTFELIEHGDDVDGGSAYNVMRTSENESEYIWSIEYDSDISQSQYPRITLPGAIRPSGIAYTRTLNMYRPISAFTRVYDPDEDLRIQNRQLFYTSLLRDGEEIQLGETVPYVWHEERAVFETARGDMNLNHVRYPQVLLIAAEAIARSEGVTSEAVGYLADVRDRAYWQTDRNVIETELSILTEQEFVEEVWKERLRELALDFKVWADIQRTRQYPVTSADNPGEVEFVDVVGASNNWGQTYQEHHLLYPIPDEEMQRNENLVQNPGYGGTTN